MSSPVVITFSESTIDPGRVILSQTGVVDFKVGMKIKVEYVNPTAGWTVIWLMDEKDNVVLAFSARTGGKKVTINSRVDDKWGPNEVRPDGGYDFTPGVTQNVLIDTEQDHFVIRVNKEDLAQYPYVLPPTSIQKVVVQYRLSGDAEPTKLNLVAYKY